MSLNFLTSQTSESFDISNRLLTSDKDCKIKSIKEQEIVNTVLVPNDLLIFNSDNTKVAVRITATDLENLLPELINLGFEVLGVAAEYNIIEGFIGCDTLSSLEELTEKGLLGVIPIYQPITNTEGRISQVETYNDDQTVISETGNNIPNDGLDRDISGKNTENNNFILDFSVAEDRNIIQDDEVCLLDITRGITSAGLTIVDKENDNNLLKTATNEMSLNCVFADEADLNVRDFI